MPARILAPLAGLLTLLGLLAAPTSAGEPPARPAGASVAVAGEEAAGFAMPADARLVRTLRLGTLTYRRYQQYLGPARVLGGQLTVLRDSSGRVLSVVGSHYAGIAAANAVAISRVDARETADREVGAGERRTELVIDPATGRYLFLVETRSLAERWIHWIDAETGRVVRVVDALAEDHGAGVKGDTKDVNGPDDASPADDLTTFHGSTGHGSKGQHWDLFSTDNRQWTFDAKNRTSLLYYVTDKDNHWTTVTSDRKSPGHPALVDAQYYANTTDDYFLFNQGFNWQSCYSRMQSVGHYSRAYNNAFWNGTYVVYGDGDGVSFRELSGGLDVVAHEHAHGITDCTSNLIYRDESGALNEAFSDILGSSAEFFAAEPTTSRCVLQAGQTGCADWWIGEDVYLPADAVVGFRNMADPQEDGDPDHYAERQVGGDDNGGVHSNSAIPNHAYYLLVNGGQNAGCDAVGSNGHTHTQNCDVTVAGIGLAAAERIFFLGFVALTETATMCDARLATSVQAVALFGSGSVQDLATRSAWEAVGVTAALCGS